MKCPKCQTENPDENRFCRECGSKLSQTCPQCSAEVLLSDKFCGKCGNTLSKPPEPITKELSFDEKLEKIQKYLPKGLTDKILSQRDKIEGERKNVTVLFADMVGFTSLIEKIGPEEAYTIMDQVYEILIHKVHDYEGTVNEMTGDGIMALFGAPIALEDAPQRAIRSAYSIHREIVRLNDKLKQERGAAPDIKMRIGIHTGPVVVGTLGNDLRVEFKAVGDTVNLASRIEQVAVPGTTYVSDEVFKLAEGFFRCEALGHKALKGKDRPIMVYQVIAPSSLRTKFDVSADQGLTPFTGRERELEILLDCFHRAKSGKGQAVSIVSDAGIGKSRLLYEFRKAITNEDKAFLEGRCLSYNRNIAFHLHIDILKAYFDIREGDQYFDIKNKIQKGLEILGGDEKFELPYLYNLLSVKDSGIDELSLSPESYKYKIIEQLKNIAIKGSENRPLVLAYEDLHWIDKNSEEALKTILESIPTSKILLIFTYRSDYIQTWGGKSYHSQVNLNRLSNRECLKMASHLLNVEGIQEDLEELILDKTEGIPFFIEEFIKSLKELKLIKRKNGAYYLTEEAKIIEIPSTIQEVIMARVDSLPERAKEVIQVGSAIEREFSFKLIQHVMRLLQEELLSNLSILKDLELIYERGIFPNSTYIFKHALTQEVVYASIMTQKKKRLHKDIGNLFEKLYINNIDEYYEIIAEHYIDGEDYEKGAEYSRLAEKKAEKTTSFLEAIIYAEKGITCLEKLPKNDEMQKRIIGARTTLGLYFFQLHNHIKAKESIDPIIDIALKISSNKTISRLHTIMGGYYNNIEGHPKKALDRYEEALKITEETDGIAYTTLCFGLGMVLCSLCKFKRALKYLEKMVEINVTAKNIWGISICKSALSNAYLRMGKPDMAYKISKEAVNTAEISGDFYTKAHAYLHIGASYYFKGFFNQAKEFLLKALDNIKKIKMPFNEASAYERLGDIYIYTSEYQLSIDNYEKAISVLEINKTNPDHIRLYKTKLYKVKAMKKEDDINLDSLFSYVSDNNDKRLDGLLHNLIGEILLNINSKYMVEAEKWIKKAIETNKENGLMFALGMSYTLYSEWYRRKRDSTNAKENLIKAIEILDHCGADGWVERYKKEMAQL